MPLAERAIYPAKLSGLPSFGKLLIFSSLKRSHFYSLTDFLGNTDTY